MMKKRRIRSVAATGIFLLLVAATFFTYWQKATVRLLGSQPTSSGMTQSDLDELQRWRARILPAPADDEAQRWESRFPNVAR